MKLKKIIAAVAAAAVSVSAFAVTAFADSEYTAKLGFADTQFSVNDWETSTTVTGDGQYTIESTAVAGAPDLGVFVIDIEKMFSDAPEATATLDKVEIDGAEVAFAADKIIYGDIEQKGNYRIEIFNQYGDTKNDPPIPQATAVNTSIKVTFTVSGLGSAGAAPAETAASEAAAETPSSDSSTTSATTGNAPAAVMLSVMALAGAAAVASKKRK